MNGQLLSWLTHPVTLTLVLVALGMLALITEILIRRLAEFGNVRFQGLVEDHAALLSVNGEEPLHLASVSIALRWYQMVVVGLFWATLFAATQIGLGAAFVVGIAVPVLVAVLAVWPFGGLGEEGAARLLRWVKPVVWPLARMSGASRRARAEVADDDEEEASDREIQAFLDVGQAAGIIEGEEGEILESLVEFFDTTVREVMTPRTDMVTVRDDALWDDLLAVFADSRKSRIPVYRDTVDHIVGVVHVRDMVTHLDEETRPTVGDLQRPCLVVPEGKELGALLRDFQQEHQQMAIVVDEYGGTAGLVTLEDILEEIVGEIEDEHDASQPPESEEVEPGVFRMQGRAPLETLEELLDVDLDEEDVDTVGGLVFSRHGTVPDPGTEVVDEDLGLMFVVEEMDQRRIQSVKVSTVENRDDSTADD
jgi:putative hemolysin